MKRRRFIAMVFGLFMTLGCEEPPVFEKDPPQGEPLRAKYEELKEEERAQSEVARSAVEENRTRLGGADQEENLEEEEQTP